MSSQVQILSFNDLLVSFVPVFIVLVIIYIWKLDFKNSIFSLVRMLGQLLIIGYFLATIFESDSAYIIIAILCIMVLASSWIALGTIKTQQKKLFRYAAVSILIGGGFTLFVISQGVLHLQPWYFPQYIIPISGMIFANAMNSLSLAAERFFNEIDNKKSYTQARNIAMKAALIPITNSLFAVGLVSIPGMMTGQILSGVEPYIAARYQIMVMSMIFASSGISAACFLLLIKERPNSPLN